MREALHSYPTPASGLTEQQGEATAEQVASLGEDLLSRTRPDSEDARVQRALDRLADLHARPVAEHVEVYDEVHRLLQDTLASLDEA